MQYQVLVSQLKNFRIDNAPDEIVGVPHSLLMHLLKAALKGKREFDESFYVENNADIQAALGSRKIRSGASHYYSTGYFEGRKPKRFLVDEKFYLAENPDVVNAIRKGLVKNAQEHYDAMGFQENRVPFKGFSLF